MLIILQQSMEQHSVERRAVIVFAKYIFPAKFCQKNLKFLNLFETDSTIPIAFLNFDDPFQQKYL